MFFVNILNSNTCIKMKETLFENYLMTDLFKQEDFLNYTHDYVAP